MPTVRFRTSGSPLVATISFRRSSDVMTVVKAGAVSVLSGVPAAVTVTGPKVWTGATAAWAVSWASAGVPPASAATSAAPTTVLVLTTATGRPAAVPFLAHAPVVRSAMSVSPDHAMPEITNATHSQILLPIVSSYPFSL